MLYKRIDLVVPHNGDGYETLENLLSSSGEGFKSTKSIGIWNPREHYQYEPEDEEDDEDEEDVDGTSITGLSVPSDAWSKTLNTLVRLLILRIPRGSLHSFMSVTLSLSFIML